MELFYSPLAKVVASDQGFGGQGQGWDQEFEIMNNWIPSEEKKGK